MIINYINDLDLDMFVTRTNETCKQRDTNG